MSEMTIRPAYSSWPEYNRRLRDVVAAMTDEQLAIRRGVSGRMAMISSTESPRPAITPLPS